MNESSCGQKQSFYSKQIQLRRPIHNNSHFGFTKLTPLPAGVHAVVPPELARAGLLVLGRGLLGLLLLGLCRPLRLSHRRRRCFGTGRRRCSRGVGIGVLLTFRLWSRRWGLKCKRGIGFMAWNTCSNFNLTYLKGEQLIFKDIEEQKPSVINHYGDISGQLWPLSLILKNPSMYLFLVGHLLAGFVAEDLLDAFGVTLRAALHRRGLGAVRAGGQVILDIWRKRDK